MAALSLLQDTAEGELELGRQAENAGSQAGLKPKALESRLMLTEKMVAYQFIHGIFLVAFPDGESEGSTYASIRASGGLGH